MPADRRTLAFLAAAAVPLGCAGESAKVVLRYHPPTGVTYRYTLEQHNTMRFESGPMARLPEQQLGMRMYFSQAITGPGDSGRGVSVTVRFDSTVVDSPLMAASVYRGALDHMRGLTSKLVYDDRMNVVRAQFADPGPIASPLAEQLGKNFKGMTFPLPDRPAGVGDSWTAMMEMPIAQLMSASGPLKAKTRLTLKEIRAAGSDTTVVLGLETTYPGEPITVHNEMGSQTVTLTGTLKGEQVFSVTKGAALESTMGGSIRIHLAGGALGSNGVDMTMQQQTTLHLSGAP